MTARTHHLTALLLSASLAGPAAADAVPQATRDARRVLDPTSLSHDDAASEEGRRGLYLIRRTNWPAFLEDGRVTFACAGPRGMGWTASLRRGQGVGKVMVVEAELRLVWHPRSADGVTPGFWEYRLVDAAVVESREN